MIYVNANSVYIFLPKVSEFAILFEIIVFELTIGTNSRCAKTYSRNLPVDVRVITKGLFRLMLHLCKSFDQRRDLFGFRLRVADN